jgi:hypothetical protein
MYASWVANNRADQNNDKDHSFVEERILISKSRTQDATIK